MDRLNLAAWRLHMRRSAAPMARGVSVAGLGALGLLTQLAALTSLYDQLAKAMQHEVPDVLKRLQAQWMQVNGAIAMTIGKGVELAGRTRLRLARSLRLGKIGLLVKSTGKVLGILGAVLMAGLDVRQGAMADPEMQTPAEAGVMTAGPARGATDESEGHPLLTAVRGFSRRTLSRVNPDTVSKVVDAEGRPLRVYRGEHGEDTGSEVQTKIGSVTFTDDPEVASTYELSEGRSLRGAGYLFVGFASVAALIALSLGATGVGIVLALAVIAASLLLDYFKPNNMQLWLERCYERGNLEDQRYRYAREEERELAIAMGRGH